MNNIRNINEYFKGEDTEDGAGVSLKRIFGYYDTPKFDPFLLMDFFDSKNPQDYVNGFPWHPHRGIETITYLISGEIRHEDTLRNTGSIKSGDCQWMTAGSGIMHQEMPVESEHLFGVQIWLNLPASEKMSQPRYENIESHMIPVIEEEGVKISIIAGSYKDNNGPIIKQETKPIFFDIELEKNSRFEYELSDDFNAFATVIEGEVLLSPKDELLISKGNGGIYGDGEKIVISTKDKKSRILFLAGQKLDEDIAWGGPIVMNTKNELKLAFKDIKDKNFIR